MSARGQAGARTPDAAELAADLQDWTLHLQAGSFTQTAVAMLQHDLRRAVPSALGYTLRLLSGSHLPPVSITVADRVLLPEEVRSSISVTLVSRHGVDATATFYAGAVDAFDQIADLLAVRLGLPRHEVSTGDALDRPVTPGIEGMTDYTRVSYALGVLVGRGFALEAAREQLQLLVDRYGSPGAAADAVLGTV